MERCPRSTIPSCASASAVPRGSGAGAAAASLRRTGSGGSTTCPTTSRSDAAPGTSPSIARPPSISHGCGGTDDRLARMCCRVARRLPMPPCPSPRRRRPERFAGQRPTGKATRLSGSSSSTRDVRNVCPMKGTMAAGTPQGPPPGRHHGGPRFTGALRFSGCRRLRSGRRRGRTPHPRPRRSNPAASRGDTDRPASALPLRLPARHGHCSEYLTT